MAVLAGDLGDVVEAEAISRRRVVAPRRLEFADAVRAGVGPEVLRPGLRTEGGTP